MSQFVVIAGMSGAGRSQAADNLEDLGWFVMDNLPPLLIPKVVELAAKPTPSIDRLALVVGTGSYHQDHQEFGASIARLREGLKNLRILFLDASTEVLVRRYESTRRRHPFAAEGTALAGAIETERLALDTVRSDADLVIDTSDLNIHQLRDRMSDLFGSLDDSSGMHTTVLSFGYKHGVPLDVDIVIDCRFLPNPHWVEELRPLTGRSPAVVDYLMDQPVTAEFVEHLAGLLELLVPHYEAEGKSYLTIAFGCTGGHHRSVMVAERVAALLAGSDPDLADFGDLKPALIHRDIDK